MALPPGYLALLEAARAHGLTEDKFTRDDAIAIEQHMHARGWVISADLPGSGVSNRARLMTVFPLPSGEDDVSEVINEVAFDPHFPCLSYQFNDYLGEFSVRAPSVTLDELARKLRAIPGVMVEWG